jgi:CDP-glucose 4,6-dehydratase
MPTLDPRFWRGRRVLLTGHTGFKGGWAALWLHRLGARVTGLALPAEHPSFHDAVRIDALVETRLLDLQDADAIVRAVGEIRPEIVLHLAAQPIIRRSLVAPVETFAVNVMGTVHLLDALRALDGVAAVLVVTSDKVYRNSEAGRPFTEDDRLGGKDPYSGSKAACEIVTESMAQSFLEPRGIRWATARGGNVVGGGDFAADRLVPDCVRAVRAARPLVLRHPEATRPWQHVLDCLAGYLAYLQGLGQGADLPTSLNFGPAPAAAIPVGALATAMLEALGAPEPWRHQPEPGSIEMKTLSIDSSRARASLGWHDRLTGAAVIAATADWYRAWHEGEDMRAFSLGQIENWEYLP